jgi:hypothetical protein
VIPAARYLLSEHLRTRGFVAPTVVLLAGVVVLYAQPPNPVISTAGTVAAFLFAAQCWLALGLFNSQGTADRQVLVATVGGRRFALARLLARQAARCRRARRADLGARPVGVCAAHAAARPAPGGADGPCPHAGEVPARLAGDLASVALFAVAVAVVCSLLWRRRE